jgi:hypothetical protein
MRHATSLLYHVCAVTSRNIRFASCGTSGKLTLWTCLVYLRFRIQVSSRSTQPSVERIPYMFTLLVTKPDSKVHYYSPPTSAEVKNMWNNTTTSHTSLQLGVCVNTETKFIPHPLNISGDDIQIYRREGTILP